LDIEVDDEQRMIRLVKSDHGRKVSMNVGRACLVLSIRTAARLGVTENYATATHVRDDGIYFPMPPVAPVVLPETKWSIPLNTSTSGSTGDTSARQASASA
jgi:hypothetical protein